ncbi:single-stranded DNA-binding protein [Janthinobacterium sp. B9-8]|uniref:single-stranded DNA-binding protein n=1 Tax=Janthinobacterium sp. B9-8 TaxID=1236179 RepID=UPI00061D0DD9|nr:single-stranded DNA-binding protein [Janthinobacterium sp. B9-8]
MNKITITGRLGRDSELRALPNGDPVLSFAVADDVGFGEKKHTQWFSCALFGKRAQALAAYLKKGQQIVVFGSLDLREWNDKEGQKRTTPEVRVDEVVLGSRPESTKPAAAPSPTPAPSEQNSFSDFEDDIPF